MPRVIFPEYREQFDLTAYPFIDNATLTSLEKEITLPKDLFVDASIYIPGATPPAYIQSISISNTSKTITISDYSKKFTATGTINPISDSIILYSNGKQVGILVAGSNGLGYFTSVSTGDYEFSYKATSFAPRCFIELKDIGVSSIGIKDGDTLTGDVWLCGKDGIILRGLEGNKIRFDVVGVSLSKQQVYGDEFEPKNYIQTINNLKPNEDGNFIISVLNAPDILRINNNSEGITLSATGI